MIEGTPGRPYGGLLAHFNLVEANMKFRREQMQQGFKTKNIYYNLFPCTFFDKTNKLPFLPTNNWQTVGAGNGCTVFHFHST